MRWISLLYSLHLASLFVAVIFCARHFGAAETVLLCASAWFLILGRVADLGALDDFGEDGSEALARDLEKANATLLRFERRQASLNELLACQGLIRRCDALNEWLLISRRLNVDDPGVEQEIYALRERLLDNEARA
ncbi:hypothetical protein QCE49_32880 [Caballeronia sp. LZ008]|uniref:hypothetical protein n=1 Tax=unclassified Caballeronia TaxID=2646786 RepID=UPI002028D792|nr:MULTISPECIES: hypothetical protein [unclassified Caballeronia]MDR5798196.1 hypothetical protein [Caballeronia sp. LZ008]